MGLINNGLKAVITEEEGKQVQQWDLNEQIKTHAIDITQFEKGKPVEGNEAEGCVYDDENETIFISREGDKGILKLSQWMVLNIFRMLILEQVR